MQKHLLLSTFLGLYLGVWGQISLNSSNFPNGASKTFISSASNMEIDLTKVGPNQTWDLSKLLADTSYYVETNDISEGGMLINIQFGVFAAPKYQADYFEYYDAIPLDALSQLGNILPVQIGSMNRYVKVENDKITYPGYSLTVNGQQIGFKSATIEEGYKFPLSYGDTYTSDGTTDFDFSIVYDAEIKQHRHRETQVDAFGKLIVPYTAVYQVIRLHHHITEQDSIRVNIFGFNQWFNIPRTMDIYEWRSTKLKQPILKVETESVLGNSFTKKVTFYRTPVPHGTHLFPNPALTAFKIQSDEGIKSIVIYDLQGKEIKKQAISSPETLIDVSTLAAGRYTVQAFSSSGIKYYPLIVE